MNVTLSSSRSPGSCVEYNHTSFGFGCPSYGEPVTGTVFSIDHVEKQIQAFRTVGDARGPVHFGVWVGKAQICHALEQFVESDRDLIRAKCEPRQRWMPSPKPAELPRCTSNFRCEASSKRASSRLAESKRISNCSPCLIITPPSSTSLVAVRPRHPTGDSNLMNSSMS